MTGAIGGRTGASPGGVVGAVRLVPVRRSAKGGSPPGCVPRPALGALRSSVSRCPLFVVVKKKEKRESLPVTHLFCGSFAQRGCLRTHQPTVQNRVVHRMRLLQPKQRPLVQPFTHSGQRPPAPTNVVVTVARAYLVESSKPIPISVPSPSLSTGTSQVATRRPAFCVGIFGGYNSPDVITGSIANPHSTHRANTLSSRAARAASPGPSEPQSRCLKFSHQG